MNGTWWVDPSQLDDDQRDVIQLPRDGNFLIIGPPGSGKTNLLLLRANYLFRADRPNIMIIVFARTLKEFLTSGAGGYNFPNDKIQTYSSWVRTLLWENGIELDTVKDFRQERLNIFNAISELVTKKRISRLYDAILLDEVHDYSEKEIEIIYSLANNIFAVGHSRQQIYRTDDSIGCLKQKVDRTVSLKYHYRNGIEICRLADSVAKSTNDYLPMVETSNYDEVSIPSSVQYFKCKTIDEQCTKVISDLKTQVEAYPSELLGVICPRHSELAKIRSIFSESPLISKCIFQDSDVGYEHFDSNKPICVTTLHSAKGLEFRALHIMACDTLKKFPRNRNMTYTGITRAKTSLSLYYNGTIPGYLDSALREFNPRNDLPSIAEAFGRGG